MCMFGERRGCFFHVDNVGFDQCHCYNYRVSAYAMIHIIKFLRNH